MRHYQYQGPHPRPGEFDPVPVPAGALREGTCSPYDYRCPKCGSDLAYDPGDPGKTTGLPENCYPSEPSGWYCENPACEETFETEWE